MADIPATQHELQAIVLEDLLHVGKLWFSTMRWKQN